jgi:hypothetical protein
VALDKPAKPEQTGDSALRSAVVKVAKYYLRMAQSKSPAEMEAMIWGVDSVDGARITVSHVLPSPASRSPSAPSPPGSRAG